MTKNTVMLVLFLAALCGGPSAYADPKTLFDFESGDLQGWKVVEGTFGKLVTDRAVFHNTPTPYNKQGKYFLSTLEQPDDQPNDRYTGIIESPRFAIDGDFLSFLHGGGAHANTYIALCDDSGKELLRASDGNDETMGRTEWDVRPFRGKRMFLRVVDKNEGGWGHVTLDDVQIEPAESRERRLAEVAARRAEVAAQTRKKFDARWKRTQERFESPDLLARGAQRVYRGEYLDGIAMPVGGIGAGTIQMNGKAEPAIWQIFNNHSNARVPDSFLAIRVKTEEGKPVVRALQAAAVGPFAPMKALNFRGAYPFGWYTFEDPEVPVKISLETFSPLTPLDARNSAIPCAVFNVTVENPTKQAVEVTLMAAQQNAVGYLGNGNIEGRAHPGYRANTNEIIRDKGATLLHMTADQPKDAPGSGDMVLMALADEVTGTAAWEGLDKLAEKLTSAGALSGPDKAGPSPAGQTLDGALAVSLKVPPGGTRTVSFVLVWYFPNGPGNWGGPGGNMYANWWPDALGAARELEKTLPELSRRTHLYHDTLYESNLPYWLLDRISSQVAVLRSRTCFWTKEGYFGGWEGCNPGGGCCHGNCDHVWHYAQTHARLFPAIARRMREQEFRFQQPDGGIPHRQPGEFPAFDGQCGAVLNSYREHLMSPDGKWLDAHWPAIKKAMDFTIAAWDKDEDGVLAGPQWNTLDGALGGSSSWLGSLYLAALAAAEKMSLLKNEPEAAKRYARILASGSRKQDATLFNGEYYIQIPDQEAMQDYGNGCHIDQVLGQWWAHQLDLGWVYPPDHVRSALASLLKYNFNEDFHGVGQSPRKFVADDDSGLQMITWPKDDNGRKGMQYASEVMTGFEYSAAAAMIQAGMLREGLMVAHSTWVRYDGRLRTGLSGGDCTSWGFSGNPFGDDECGKFYARAMSSWSLLLASQGFLYDGPAGCIGFDPVWKPEDHVSFFTAAEGWGLFRQVRDKTRQQETIELRWGRMRLRTLVFACPREPRKVEIAVNGKPVPATHAAAGGKITISLQNELTLTAGQALRVVLE